MEKPTNTFDVIVVGAGIIGSCAAYQTAKRGQSTLLLDQFDFLHHRGSSHGESRTIRTTYPEPYYSEMVLQSSLLWREAEAEIGYQVYFETTQFDMGPSDSKALQAVISSCKRNSIPCKISHAHQLFDENPLFHLPENWIGVATEHGGVLKPTKAVSMFQSLAIKNGATLRDNMEVIDISRENIGEYNILVHTKGDEKFRAKKCIITAGAWMKKLVNKIDSNLMLPIQPLETTVHYWRIKEGHEAEFTINGGGFPTFASYGEPYIYGTPSLEFPGLIKVAVHGGRHCEPEQRTWSGGDQVTMSLLREWIRGRFGERVDSVNGPVMTQSCIYSMTPDEDFVIDFLGGVFGEDVVVAGGFSGHGFKMGPVVGRILADLVVSGEAKDGEMEHFRIRRFEGNPKGNVKEFDDQVIVTGIANEDLISKTTSLLL